jgi:hypothetical protein
MSSKSSRYQKRASHAGRRRPDLFAKPRCELLEDRLAPALFEVQSPLSFSGLNNNGCVAVTDLDKDGFADAILTNFGTDYATGAGSTITVLYGKEGGGFDRIQLNTGGFNVSFASVGDINGDTWPDVVVSNANRQNAGSISVFQNDGAGNLSPATGSGFSSGGNNSSWVGLADVTGDTVLDVVVASFGRDAGNDTIEGKNVAIFEGNGDFTFNTSPTILDPGLAFLPTALAIADFDGDGLKDIAASSPGIPPDFGQPYPQGLVYVFRNTGSGGFSDPNTYDTGGVLPVNIQVAHLNADTKPDLIVANAGDPNGNPAFVNDGVGVILNVSSSGNINFGVTNSLTANTNGVFAVAITDYNLDGHSDIAAVNYGGIIGPPAATVSVYTGNGTGVFTPGSPGSYDTQTSLGGGQYLAAGDYDNNGTPDLIVAHASNLVGVLVNTSVPQISTTTTLTSSVNPSSVGESVTFTATVAASSTVDAGTVTFFDNGTAMGPAVTLTNQQAAFTTTSLGIGNHIITAEYSGGGGFSPSTSNTVTQIVNPGTAQGFTFTGVPLLMQAGGTFNFTVTARDQSGNVATGYRGTVHFTSSDGQASLPGDYTFTAADNGARTFTVTYRTEGTQSLTVTDTVTSSITGTVNTVVRAGVASTFTITDYPSSTTAGVSQNFTVTAMDEFGNVADGYRGTVLFTSSDGQATLPSSYTFTEEDGGSHQFAATLASAGSQSITVTDTTTSSINGSQTGITVIPAAAASFTFTGMPSSVTAGVAQNVTLTARDAFGNTATGYTGTVQFTSTDLQAGLPANYTFTGADAGVHTFAVTLNTPGSQSLTATDTTTGTITGNVSTTVTSAAATHFLVSAPATATAGTSFTVTVSALNASNNVDAGYRGTVHFVSSDGQAILPADYTFTAGDAGTHTFTVTLGTAGSQSITATDVATSTITGNDSVTVNAAAVSQFLVAAPPSATSGTPFNVSVTARDAFGNTVTSYLGTVSFTSSDAQAVLPGNYTFTGADAGTHTFSVTLNTNGAQTVTATDTANGSIVGSDTIAVGASPPPPPTAQPYAVGSTRGIGTVTMFNPNNTVRFSTQPFGPNYRKGIRIAVGDVTGDGVSDVVAATNGGVRAKVRVIDGATGAVQATNLLGATQNTGKVSVAVGDVNGDGTNDIAVGLNQGGSLVRIYSDSNHDGIFTKVTGFRAGSGVGFLGGTNVAIGEMTGDGKADVVVSATYAGRSIVRGYSGASLAPGLVPQRAFAGMVLGGRYVNGLWLAVGEVNGDSRADLIIGSAAGTKPNVKVFSGSSLVDDNVRDKIADFKPEGSTAKTGVRVATRNLNDDGQLEILVSSGELVSGYRLGSLVQLFAFDPNPALNGAVWVG